MNIKNKLKKQLESLQTPVWKPTKKAILVLLLLSCFLAILSNIEIVSTFTNKGLFLDSPLDRVTLLSIHTSIGGILIALAFFVAQSAGIENKQEKSYVLMQHSYFFPLLTIEIFWLFVFILPGKINLIGAVVTSLIGLGTVLSLYQVTRLLSNNQLMERESKKALLKLAHEGVINLLDRDVTSRKANIALLEKFKDSDILSIHPYYFYHEGVSDYYVDAKDKGFIADIKSNKLTQLESYLKGKLKLPDVSKDGSSPEPSFIPNKEAPAKVIKLVNADVEYDSNIFVLDTVFFEGIDFRKVDTLIKEAFVIKKDDLIEDSRTKFRQLKDRCIEAIKNEHTGELEKLLLLYPELMTGFYNYVEGGLSAEQAHNESQTLGQKIMPFDWFIGDIEDIFNQGITSNNKKIISETAYLPIRLIGHSIKHEDHLFFDGLLRFSSSLYFASKEDGQSQKKYLKDRSWRHLYELLKISMRLSAKHKNLTSGNYKAYAEKILIKFQDLLKSAVDDRDNQYFNNLLEEIFSLFDSSYFMRGEDQFEEVQLYLKQRVQEMFFGTAAWVLHLYKNNLDDQNLEDMYINLTNRLAQTVSDFTQEFLNVSSPEADSFWDRWHWWEMEGKSSHKAHYIAFDQKLNALFVTHSLRLLSNKSKQDIANMTIPYNRHLADLAVSNRKIIDLLNQMTSMDSQWREFIAKAEVPINKIEVFKVILEKAKDQQESDDSQYLREQSISQEKVDKFKVYVNRNYLNSRPIFKVFKNINKYSVSVNSDMPRLAMNTLFNKAAFFPEDADWHTTHVGLEEGFRFGESIMRAENNDVLTKIISKCEKITSSNLHQTIESKASSDLIMIATNSALFDLFPYNDPNYKTATQAQRDSHPNIEGVYQIGKKLKIPVYQFYADIQQDYLILLEKNKIGHFEHYIKSEGGQLCNVTVNELTPDAPATKKIIEQKPDWLTEKRTIEQQIKHLEEHVQILVSESFSYQPDEKFEGYVFYANEPY